MPIPVHEVDTDGRGHPIEKGTMTILKGTMTILKGLKERLSEDLFFSAKLATSRRPYAGVQGVYRFDCRTSAVKREKYPAPLEICSSCRAEMAAYDGAAKWVIFVASLAVTPPGEFVQGLVCAVHAKRNLNISIDVAPTSKWATIADTTPSLESNSDGGK